MSKRTFSGGSWVCVDAGDVVVFEVVVVVVVVVLVVVVLVVLGLVVVVWGFVVVVFDSVVFNSTGSLFEIRAARRAPLLSVVCLKFISQSNS